MFSDWDKLLYLIEEGECVLFLGPQLPLLSAEGERLDPRRDLIERIVAQFSDEAGEPGDGSVRPSLAVVAQQLLQDAGGGQVSLEMAVRQWHKSLATARSTLHDRLAELPFEVIVSSCHDPFMKNAMEAAGKEPNVLFYNYQGGFDELGPTVSARQPLLYHLFGHVSEPESLVFTDIQLLDFITSLISKTPSLPNDVTEVLANSRTFLFLGFGMGEWYLRILLHYLKILKKVDKSANKAFAVAVEEHAPSGQAVLFYERNFKFEVLEQQVIEFVEELRGRYVPPESADDDVGAASEGSTPAPSRRPDVPTVFICHASENADVAKRLHGSLERANLRPWLDQDALRGGDRWDDLIEETIEEVDYFVVLYSAELAAKAAVKSYVNKEIELAREASLEHGLKSFIIPAKIDGTEPQADKRLKKFHSVDLTQGGDKALIRAIKRGA